MEIYLVIYITATMIVMLVDSMTCLIMEVRFQFFKSLAGAIIWPIAIPIVLFLMVKKTKHLPKYTESK